MMRFWRRKYDRIQLGRKQYRIEFNWNTHCRFMEAYNMKFGDLKSFEDVNPGQIITYFYEAIIEGCRLENKKFPYSKEDFAALLSSESMSAMALVLQSQHSGAMKNLQKDAENC